VSASRKRQADLAARDAALVGRLGAMARQLLAREDDSARQLGRVLLAAHAAATGADPRGREILRELDGVARAYLEDVEHDPARRDRGIKTGSVVVTDLYGREIETVEAVVSIPPVQLADFARDLRAAVARGLSRKYTAENMAAQIATRLEARWPEYPVVDTHERLTTYFAQRSSDDAEKLVRGALRAAGVPKREADRLFAAERQAAFRQRRKLTEGR